MTAHILIVEDNESFINALQSIISDVKSNSQVIVARSRDEALTSLNAHFFDFAILDLKIPISNDVLDLDPKHGKYVFHYARKVTPGTKILVLTESPSEDFIAELLKQKHDADIWSEGTKIDTVEFLRKRQIDEAPEIIAAVINAIGGLSDIELDLRDVNLTTSEDRLARIFARRFAAVRCVVSKIGNGRSGSRTLRVMLYDAGGALIRDVFAKFGSPYKMLDEDRRYEGNVVLLEGAATPRKMAMLEFGAGPLAGLFYHLATEHDVSMFGAAVIDEKMAARAVASTAIAISDWSKGKAATQMTVADIRRTVVDDERAIALRNEHGLSWAAAFESKPVSARWCCVHGDLHGENILVADGDRVMIIDYGDVGHHAASYDPVSLELSIVLQKNPSLNAASPSIAACRQWHDLDAYAAETSHPLFIRACRTWATEIAAGKREIAASAYSYLLRQLKYDDVDKARVLALLDGVQACMAST